MGGQLLVSAVFVAMTSNIILCILPLLTSVLALPAADLLDHVHPRHEELDVLHPSIEQNSVTHQAGDQTASNKANLSMKERATECALFLCIRDGSATNSTYPWLINNKNARFAYVRTDSEGFSSYSYQRIYAGQTLLYYLHFYDEGLFYNGFWVVNDLETGFVETEGHCRLLVHLGRRGVAIQYKYLPGDMLIMKFCTMQ